jgi:hypothetical protein
VDRARKTGNGIDTDAGSDEVSVHTEADDSADRPTDPVELGVSLLGRFEGAELSVAAAVDRIETITTDPQLTREILDTAQRRGVLARENGVFRVRSSEFVRFESQVISKEGEFSCRRCGAGLSTGYFLDLEAGEHGPFGSSCIRKVTGRDRE